MSTIQLLVVGVTALLVYDYFLTLKDEVVGFHDDNDAETNLTTSSRSGMHGSRRASSVRRPSHFLWDVLTDDTPVFVLFLFVSVPHYRRHISLTVV